jgi:uncharacterized membrane protein
MELFDNFMDPAGGGDALGRYLHYLAGITWIGLLYFFNFIQGSAFKELSDGARSEALRKITWRTLWWFRWGAMLTFLSGVWLLYIGNYFESFPDAFNTSPGLGIAFGALLGTTMFLNVWTVIWPAQQVVIGSANAVAGGGQPDPEAPGLAKRAGRASRVNTLFSITVIWFMMWPSHFGFVFSDLDSGGRTILWIVFLIWWVGMEASALGLIGGYDNKINQMILDKHQNTIIEGLAFTAVLYVLWEIVA